MNNTHTNGTSAEIADHILLDRDKVPTLRHGDADSPQRDSRNSEEPGMGKRTVKAFTARPWVAEKMEHGTLPVIDEGIDCRQVQNKPILGQKGRIVMPKRTPRDF